MTVDRRRELGMEGEQHALEHLQRLGYELVARNHRTRFGEIDLIVARDSTLAFVEVKTRRAWAEDPLEKLGARKRVQVRRMARAWLAERSGGVRYRDLRFDAVGVRVDAAGALVALEHLEGAF